MLHDGVFYSDVSTEEMRAVYQAMRQHGQKDVPLDLLPRVVPHLGGLDQSLALPNVGCHIDLRGLGSRVEPRATAQVGVVGDQ